MLLRHARYDAASPSPLRFAITLRHVLPCYRAFSLLYATFAAAFTLLMLRFDTRGERYFAIAPLLPL